jgi:hypothetical protein
MIKSRKMRWTGHVACKKIREMHMGFEWENRNGNTTRKT